MPDPDEPTPVDDVFVIGTRAVLGGPKSGGGGGAGNSGGINQNQIGEEPTGPPEGYTQEEADEENKRQAECAAKKFGKEVGDHPRGKIAERFSITFARDGNNLVTESREATGRFEDLPVGSAVTSTDFNTDKNDHRISISQVIAFNHSHAEDLYCDGSGLLLHQQRQDNQRPSPRDWDFADAITKNDPSHPLVLYVRDCEGAVRGFPYIDRDAFKNGSKPTPDPISPIGCDDESE